MAETKVFGITVNTDSLKNIPDTYKMIAGAVIAVLILIGSLYYLVYPVYNEYQVLLEENEKLRQDISSKEMKLGYNEVTKKYKKIEDTKEEIEQLKLDIEKVQSRIPSQENLPTLIYDLEKIVEGGNKSDLFDIVPSQMQSVSLPSSLSGKKSGLDLKQVSLSLSLETDYPTLINLFKDFERYERAMATSNVSLSPQTTENNKFSTLKVALNMKAFVLPEGGK